MLKIGLTGGIGTGKSLVAKVFLRLGVPVFVSDEVARHLMESDMELMESIRHAFGDRVYTSHGLDRKYLANIVFGDSLKLEQLNDLVHPVVIRAFNEWAKVQQGVYCLKESALLFETGSAAGLDKVICVDAPMALRIQRAMARDGVGIDQVYKRSEKQIPQSLKVRLSDYVVRNDGVSLLLPQIEALDRMFKASAW